MRSRPTSPSRRQRRAATLSLRATVALVGVMVLTGCGSQSDGGTARSEAAVPGGAALRAQPGAPEVCGKLADAGDLRRLGDALSSWAQKPSASGAARDVREAGVALQRLAGSAGSLAPTLRSTGKVLREVADQGDDAASVSRLAAAMQRLGRKLEEPCGYPVG